MAYQQGQATSMAAMTGNPYIVAGAMVYDIYAGISASKKAAKAAEEQRNFMVKTQTLENRASNLQFKQELDNAADQEQSDQVAALEAASVNQNNTSGIGGATTDRVQQQFKNKFGEVAEKYERSVKSARQQNALSMKAANRSLSGRINQIEVAKYDPTEAIVSAGLAINKGYKGEKALQSAEGNKDFNFGNYMGFGGKK